MIEEEKTPRAVAVSNAEDAQAFLEFQYVEIKDLTKQFLTVVAAVLAVTVTFSEKIVDFATAHSTPRIFMMLVWGGCLASFILGGCAIFLIYNAGVLAKNTQFDGKTRAYRRLTVYSHLCLNVAGTVFVVALLLLVGVGFSRAL